MATRTRGQHRAGRRVGNRQGYAPLDATILVQAAAATGDLKEGFQQWRSWIYLAVENVKNQYRRTVLGPWWLTIQTGVYVIGLAILFSAILKADFQDFIPYVAVGFIGFNLLAGLTRVGATVFVSSASVIKSTRQPMSSLILRGVAIEMLQFAHNMLIYVFLVAIGLVTLGPVAALAIPVVILIAINGLTVGLWLGPTVARFRDVGPFVMSILQVMIFFTPVFWRVDSLHPDERAVLVGWNPFAYFLEALRQPLLDYPLDRTAYLGVAVITGVNVSLGAICFTRTRSRLPYWVS